MTKITTPNRGIIIDGHANTKEECETITLLCDCLAKDKNFKQVAYDKGYAAFERVGHTEELKFAPPIEGDITVNFDTGIESVDFKHGSATNTFTTSGELYNFFTEYGNYIILTANLKSGYSLKSSSLGSVSGNTITIPEKDIESNMICTLVSEAATVKKSVDLTTLSGWTNLSAGSHVIKLVAKGSGYRDSEKSVGVEVTKPAEVYTDCLTFTGESSEFTLAVGSEGAKEWDGTLYYSTDHNTWNIWDGTAISSVNKKLYLRGKNNTKFYTLKGAHLSLSARAGCSGNIQTLLDWENPPTSIPANNCYYSMFFDCTNLTTAPELPATTLTNTCYAYMFRGCNSLTIAPELPATTLTSHCYYNMFARCHSLQTAPELPATILSDYCYYGMFSICTNLMTAPALLATTLTSHCYFYMFNNCAKLKVNTSSGTKIFTCPSSIPSEAVSEMFTGTGGTFTGTPTAGNTYYYTE